METIDEWFPYYNQTGSRIIIRKLPNALQIGRHRNQAGFGHGRSGFVSMDVGQVEAFSRRNDCIANMKDELDSTDCLMFWRWRSLKKFSYFLTATCKRWYHIRAYCDFSQKFITSIVVSEGFPLGHLISGFFFGPAKLNNPLPPNSTLIWILIITKAYPKVSSQPAFRPLRITINETDPVRYTAAPHMGENSEGIICDCAIKWQ